MNKSVSRLTGILLVIILVLLSISFLFWEAPFDVVKGFIGGNVIVSSIAFVLLLVFATVFAPLTVMPAIPAVAVMIGPFLTAMLSVVGWTIGAVIAFLIARHAGKPILARFVPYEHIEKYEKLIPENAQFLTVVMLRMMIPVDVLSYALGLTLSMPLWKYTIATLIGVSWFSFAFAYLGDAFYTQDLQLLITLVGVSAVIFIAGWFFVFKKK